MPARPVRAILMRQTYHHETGISKKMRHLSRETETPLADAALLPSAGRARQRARTRADLLAAARRLLAEGAPVTVAAAAEAAGVSRATAYRHFSDAETLTTEAVLDAEVPSVEAALEGLADPRARALAVQSLFLRLAREQEPRFRAFLARTMDAWARGGPAAVTRGGRRLDAFRLALAPARLPRPAEDRLVQGLAMLTGIEAHVALADVCGLGPEAADATARAAAEALLDAALPAAQAPG